MCSGRALLLSFCVSQLYSASCAVLLYPVVAGNLGVMCHGMDAAVNMVAN